ncbi:gluconeogenesis factor YvcK family protein [Fimbriimonas ginsengisoli]|uniref:Putative gluconeogenesis factor n=1 Tax=Fimbriimonas ginsengisoli Gsoil 348 TaxID=661478 RepID=A0A068NNN4_FIMGI|nr:gluconeogenesis factor YvcK family protein [Fimbriimonas ginsengisoli]AIE85012.1 hypothetical protein OP10G_1644 [Fimbriimonas ginsengisoli Gsoil 348]
MIRRYRLRKLLAPTAGLQKAVGMFALGFFALLLGIGLSFRQILQPLIHSFSVRIHEGMARLVAADQVDTAEWLLGGAFLVMGSYLTYRGVRSAFNHVFDIINPNLPPGKMDVYFRRQQLANGPRIVSMGGGTGLSTLLRGFKHHSSNITAVVTVTDDGGSSGRLIQDKGMIPPGDIRNCLVALSDAEKAMTDLFQHRFRGDSGSLSGHAIGNLLIAALVDQANGDFEKAVQIASDVLAIRGRVLPATLDHVRLRAVLEDGTEVCGETRIVAAGRRIRQLHLDPVGSIAHPSAVDAIKTADIICIGPGSVYTSIIPNLLVPGIAEALRQARVPKIYICNVMTQKGESDDFTASEHVKAIVDNAGPGLFDMVLVNTGIPSESALDKYRASGSHTVEADIDRLRQMGLKVLQGNFMSETDVVRHDPMKVVARVLMLLN